MCAPVPCTTHRPTDPPRPWKRVKCTCLASQMATSSSWAWYSDQTDVRRPASLAESEYPSMTSCWPSMCWRGDPRRGWRRPRVGPRGDDEEACGAGAVLPVPAPARAHGHTWRYQSMFRSALMVVPACSRSALVSNNGTTRRWRSAPAWSRGQQRARAARGRGGVKRCGGGSDGTSAARPLSAAALRRERRTAGAPWR